MNKRETWFTKSSECSWKLMILLAAVSSIIMICSNRTTSRLYSPLIVNQNKPYNFLLSKQNKKKTKFVVKTERWMSSLTVFNNVLLPFLMHFSMIVKISPIFIVSYRAKTWYNIGLFWSLHEIAFSLNKTWEITVNLISFPGEKPH